MRILNLRPLDRPPSPRGSQALARFDLEAAPGLVLFGMLLSRDASGADRVFAAMSESGRPAASLDPDARATVIAMVRRSLQDGRNEQRAA